MDTITCPVCEHINPESTVYCINCGSPLDATIKTREDFAEELAQRVKALQDKTKDSAEPAADVAKSTDSDTPTKQPAVPLAGDSKSGDKGAIPEKTTEIPELAVIESADSPKQPATPEVSVEKDTDTEVKSKQPGLPSAAAKKNADTAKSAKQPAAPKPPRKPIEYIEALMDQTDIPDITAAESEGTDAKSRQTVIPSPLGDQTEVTAADSETGDDEWLDDKGATKRLKQREDLDSELSMGKVRMRGELLLTEEKTGTKFRITQDQLRGTVLGRASQATGFRPTIDLTGVDGHKQGVSRHHATVSKRDNLLVIVDHNSTNGTYLNGQRLVPEQPRVVRDNDLIRIGHISLRVTYQQNQGEPSD